MLTFLLQLNCFKKTSIYRHAYSFSVYCNTLYCWPLHHDTYPNTRLWPPPHCPAINGTFFLFVASFSRSTLVPASSWPALSVCARRSSGPSCSPPEWWERWDRSVSPQVSTSQGCFLSQERQKVNWNTQETDYKKTLCRTFPMTDRCADCSRPRLYQSLRHFST